MRADRGWEDERGQSDAVVETVLGTEGSPSPLAVAEGATELLEMDRLDIGTPVGDQGTAAVNPP